jgi:hypothetical protein
VLLQPLYTVLENKYYLDWFNENVSGPAAHGHWEPVSGRRVIKGIIEGGVVNASWKLVNLISKGRQAHADGLPLPLRIGHAGRFVPVPHILRLARQVRRTIKWVC